MQKSVLSFVLGCCALAFEACGGDNKGGTGGNQSFQELCDQANSLMCDKAASCGSKQPKADCINAGKAQNCAGGVEQYCGGGMTFQSGNFPACLDALQALTCLTMGSIPAACTPDVLCTPSSGGGSDAGPGETCHAVNDPKGCDPKASHCFAAGQASSCPDRALCVGDGQGMSCAARCTVDDDCLSAGPGLVCMQGCTIAIINGFCVKPTAKTTFIQDTCTDSTYATTSGISGWSL